VASIFFQSLGRGRLALLGAAIGVASFAGCGETTVSAPLPAARVEAVEGAALSGPAGLPLPDPIEVRVFGSDDQPLPGATVTFSAANGGSVNPATATTDGNGIARTRWTLGQTAGPNVLTATAASGVSITITATATGARAATVTGVAGGNQTAAAGTAVPIAPSVRVTDAFGNVVADVPVTFSVLSGGGQVTNGLRLTDSQGIATVGSWILGPAAGPNTLAARVEASGVTNNPIVFSATATPPTGSQMVATAGNNQSAPVGRLLPVAPAVVVKNSSGVGVPGVVVTFAVASGGGSVVGSVQVTDATGTATVGGWFLGPLPGTNTLQATAAGLPAVTFTATGVAGLPVSMVAVSQTTQTATAGTNVNDPPSVIVRDVSGIPVSGVVVMFTVTAGGGSVVGSPATTNANGVATLASWRLGVAVGSNTVTATATGLPSVTFNASGTAAAPPATKIAITSAPAGPITLGVNFTITVQLQNASGVAVAQPGVQLTIAIASGGGTLNGTLTLTTDANGTVTFTLINVTGAPGARTFTVTGTGLLSATTASITFN
jgi:adhesin/invasin